MERISKMWRSVLAMALAICMVISFVPVTASAANSLEDEAAQAKVVLGELKGFLETYGPDVAAQVCAQWTEKGYQEKLNGYMDELVETLEARYVNYTDVVVPALNDVIDALAIEKDALAADLLVLKAELEARKAELEEIRVEIPEISAPDFSIDAELGNNEQTQVPEKDCTSDNELEAAIADLEHAIAVIEALIADVTADIEDMAALVAEIAESVASLEVTLADVAAAAQNLKAAVDAVVDVVNNESTNEAFLDAFNTAREAALIAAEGLEVAAEAISGDFVAIAATLEECAADLYNKFDAEKEDILGAVLKAIPEKYLFAAGVAALVIKDTLEGNNEAFNVALAAKKAEIEAELNAKLAAAEVELNAELAALEAEYAPKIAEAEAKLNAKLAEIEVEIAAKTAELEAKAQAEIAALEADAAEKLAALEVELEGYVAELYNATADERATIQAQIDRVNGDIATVKADLACAIGHVENALEEATPAIVEEINNMYAEAKAAAEAAVAEAKAAYEAAVAEAKAAYEAAVAEAKAAAEAAIAAAEAATAAAIAKAEAAANAAFEQVKASADAALKEIQNIAKATREELEAAAKAAGEAAAKELENLVNNIRIDITLDLSSIQNAIKALNDTLLNLDIDSITGISFDITGLTDEMLYNATHADLKLTEDSTYVGLGDGTAATESYVELLGEHLKAEYSIKGYTNYAANGNTPGADVVNVAAYADLADAELITIGYGNVGLLSNALANALEDEPVDYDWAALVGAEMVPYVEDALNDVYAEIAALGLTEDLAAMANSIVEGIAYGAVEFVVMLPELIAAIREVNADAVIVIVGQYNPMNGAVLDFGGVAMDFTNYINYFVDGVAAYGITYCAVTGEAIFVEASEVETSNTNSKLTIASLIKLMGKNFEAFNPSAAGDAYIANQILAALNINEIEEPETPVDPEDPTEPEDPTDPEDPEVLLGDVNGDGVIDLKDLVRMRKYLAEVEEGAEIVDVNADMNGDGEIDLKDLIRVRKLLAEV